MVAGTFNLNSVCTRTTASYVRVLEEPLYPDWQLDERLKRIDREENWRRQWIHQKPMRPINIKTPQSLKRRCFFMRDRLVFRFEG